MKPILVDVDGVCADFCGTVCDFINTKNGTSFTNNDIDDDIRISLKKYWDNDVDKFVKSDGFSQMLPVLSGAKELIETCKSITNVIFLTSPYYGSKTWVYDRIKWLEKHFNATRDDVIFARNKKYVNGLLLIDDLPRNCQEWCEYNSKSSILIDAPWNKKDHVDGLITRLPLDRVPYVLNKMKDYL